MGLSTKIDLSKPFLPESLTPLFFTSIYKELSEWEKIRYNQLQGLYFNEQFMFFEGILPQRIASALLKHPQYHEHKAGLDELAKDEASHYKLFKHLNVHVQRSSHRETVIVIKVLKFGTHVCVL